MPRLQVEITTLVHLHSSLLVAYLSLLVALGFALLAVRAPRPVMLRLGCARGLVCAQGLVGTVQFFTGVPAALVAIHVAGAAACTAATAALWASMRERAEARAGQGLTSTPTRELALPAARVVGVELPPAQRRLDELEFQQLRIVATADHVDAGIEQIGRVDVEVCRGGRQRGMADVPQLEVRVGRRQRLLGVGAGLVERRRCCPAAAGSAPW